MKLAKFIVSHMEPILVEWEAFAETLFPPGSNPDRATLRDHAQAMLMFVAADMSDEQSGHEQSQKSKGLAPEIEEAKRTAAQTHARTRASDGFDINQLAAEFRALRACVLRLWFSQSPQPTPASFQEVVRFNEAIDQAQTESIQEFTLALERTRNLLLGMLGHDMRTPLSVIVLTAKYLAKLSTESEVSSAATRLVTNGARMQALLDDLIDFSRTQLGVGINVVPARVDLGEIVRDEVDRHEAANPGRKLTLEVSGDVVGAWDRNRLHQVVGNLLNNAIKHGSAHTPVEVKLAGGASHVSFSVANAGAAIPEELIDEIFEPLVRGQRTTNDADPADSGLGLGLYITRQIVRAHKGTISVRSDSSETVFAVELPR